MSATAALASQRTRRRSVATMVNASRPGEGHPATRARVPVGSRAEG